MSFKTTLLTALEAADCTTLNNLDVKYHSQPDETNSDQFTVEVSACHGAVSFIEQEIEVDDCGMAVAKDIDNDTQYFAFGMSRALTAQDLADYKEVNDNLNALFNVPEAESKE